MICNPRRITSTLIRVAFQREGFELCRTSTLQTNYSSTFFFFQSKKKKKLVGDISGSTLTFHKRVTLLKTLVLLLEPKPVIGFTDYFIAHIYVTWYHF